MQAWTASRGHPHSSTVFIILYGPLNQLWKCPYPRRRLSLLNDERKGRVPKPITHTSKDRKSNRIREEGQWTHRERSAPGITHHHTSSIFPRRHILVIQWADASNKENRLRLLPLLRAAHFINIISSVSYHLPVMISRVLHAVHFGIFCD